MIPDHKQYTEFARSLDAVDEREEKNSDRVLNRGP